MSNTTDTTGEHFEIVQTEYEATRQKLVATSRNTLAKHLAAKSGMPYKTALQVVDTYCEQNALAVPDYLHREFNVGWQKVLSIALVVVGLVLAVFGRNLHLQKQNPVVIWIVVTLLFGLAVLIWAKSLEGEVANAKVDADILRETEAYREPKA